ncbi:hypothetical protein KY284_035270 [Solanum tuberosum]|nr:hypothetical protein KY284_035270 [Solanum tuberosum]
MMTQTMTQIPMMMMITYTMRNLNYDTDLDDDDTDSNDDDIDNENLDNVANPDDDKNVPPPALYLCKPVFEGDFYVLTWQTPRILLRLDVDDSSETITATPMTNQPPNDHLRLKTLRHAIL